MELKHAQIRAQRKRDLEGAPAVGDVGPARTNKPAGRKPHKLVDNLIIEEQEPNSKGGSQPLKLLGDLTSGLSKYRDKVVEIYNIRFDQMMTESSHRIFLLAYFLHPFYFQHGGLKLVMPPLKEGQKFDPDKYPGLFKVLRMAARAILKGEQIRTVEIRCRKVHRSARSMGSRAAAISSTVLEYWKGLRRDSNADVLVVRLPFPSVAVIIFSIMPSELCDERTASLLGWINAARRSSMMPEHLIATAQLSQWYKFGLTEGNYTHSATANVKVSAVGSPSTILSTPSLLDLLNDDNVAPQEGDREALEQALFNQPDPYDLGETDRVEKTISSGLDAMPRVIRSATHWAVEEYVRLDSASLTKIISAGKTKETVPVAAVVASKQAVATIESGDENWDIED
ncbi:hypothetical protein B0H14DRAFT_3604380 [Mycena olivaceomarginata]|nr:hypothetical protein B0H14DRAFT_3604380 [Mycena olivaceomarginata]